MTKAQRKKLDVTCVSTLFAELGEGPCWSAAENALWYVNIAAKKIHRYDFASHRTDTWGIDDKVSFILPTDGGDFVIGLPGRLACFSPKSTTLKTLVSIEHDKPRNRLNDATIDNNGRLWFGTMDDDETQPRGSLYRWDGFGEPVCEDTGYVISNGPAQSPDGRYFYHTDTPARTVYRFDFADNGTLLGKEPFICIEEHAGFPDGTTVDSEGCLWIALYGGWAVRRYSPAGLLIDTIDLPCANITKVAFGGPDLKTAFVTTARQHLTSQELEHQPLAGGLFSFAAPCAGLPQRCLRA